MDTALAWLQFATCVALIALAGSHLIRYAETIAHLTGLSRSWVGLILVATVTSLPELVTGISAVTVAYAPDLAVGNVLGSCVVNLLVLGLIDVLHRGRGVFAEVAAAHRLSAALGLVLLGATALVLLLSAKGLMPRLGHVSAGSAVLVLLYGAAVRWSFSAESPAEPAAGTIAAVALRSALARCGAASVVIVAAGLWLPLVGLRLAEAMGWSSSLVGTLFVALATTAPEMAVTLAALRLRALDIAVAGLLGSNLFDLLILAIDDIAYLGGPLFEAVSPVHLRTVLMASAMTALVMVALTVRPRRRWLGLGSWAGLSLLGLFIVHAWLQLQHGT